MPGRWAGRRVLITSGPTREPLDPVRYLSNPSSGRMGFALAAEARRRGARVTVVSGPTALRSPAGVRVLPVTTGLEMYRRTLALSGSADVVIAAAAVSDWRFARTSRHKIKRTARALRLTLTPNPDIILEVGRRRRRGSAQVLVGFALETRGRLRAAREKMRRKRLDIIVANDPSSLAGPSSRAAILTRGGGARLLPALAKRRLAGEVLGAVEALWRKRSS